MVTEVCQGHFKIKSYLKDDDMNKVESVSVFLKIFLGHLCLYDKIEIDMKAGERGQHAVNGHKSDSNPGLLWQGHSLCIWGAYD